ncbi:MAG: prephenate dehydrogenase [Bdellovibrionales bacterium CG12_big_fil_rev_8_21_14_0_65_38_15]|nr:MAG: prephenate dehydrogenase [Bdellovibrionales bacterium CG22_combo_CG10-13_8_21_14_all_38_13]PIQ55194.1 MAG: prephenate dehydrogenase [Bdellovibrionales bacterium CG12_big_fil_rev_8_21_14_0_65_38_15]PIR28391.1 MAG: prephenate dehydrogenase [Bdellovibrionales bacterium CG11_big_fil_rev_8_21_14_0_20_38_13]
MKVGIIGFGRLGKLIARYLKEDADVIVCDLSDVSKEAKELGVQTGTLDEVCQCPIVIPFVPISEFENLMIQIKDKLNPKSLLVDVCSVKELPVNAMLKHLPENIQILATHPMFGPDSARETVFGHKIVLCPVRIEDKLLNDIKRYLNGHGLKVIETTAEEHDRQISHSLVLAHFIGRTLMDTGAERQEIETLGYKRLMKILGVVQNDSWQLFVDMNKYNRFADQARARFIGSLTAIDQKLRLGEE